MNDEPECSWAAPFRDWRLRLVWFASVVALAGLVASDLVEGPGHVFLFATLIATAVLLLAASSRWVCCWHNVRRVLVITLIATALRPLAACVRWLGCWRNARKLLLAGACLITLLLLIRTEENWRGKHALGQVQTRAGSARLAL